jgi:hypothetical protein
VFPDRVEVAYAYLSDVKLSRRVENRARQCYRCFDPARVVDFIDGSDSDKRFTIPVEIPINTEADVPSPLR